MPDDITQPYDIHYRDGRVLRLNLTPGRLRWFERAAQHEHSQVERVEPIDDEETAHAEPEEA